MNEWMVVTFYSIATISGGYGIYKGIRRLNSRMKYGTSEKIGEVQTREEARKTILKALSEEELEDRKMITGEF
jgi:hypothetical protein